MISGNCYNERFKVFLLGGDLIFEIRIVRYYRAVVHKAAKIDRQCLVLLFVAGHTWMRSMSTIVG